MSLADTTIERHLRGQLRDARRALKALLKCVPRSAFSSQMIPHTNIVQYTDAEWKRLVKATRQAETEANRGAF